MAKKSEQTASVGEKLRALYELQVVASEIDKIKVLRGELPLEVQDLEDEVAGLETRIQNLNDEISTFETSVQNRKAAIKESEALIAKYTEQQNNVRNNREFDSLTKEIEFQGLEIQLSNKKIKEFIAESDAKKSKLEKSEKQLSERSNDLENKRKELANIISETQVEEEKLLKKSEKIEKKVEERLLVAFHRIRSNARNGLAVATVQRDACGGCFNLITPQRQMDILARKKVLVCEYCGRILVDQNIMDANDDN
ncbi:MAG: zinc ribbon domain-containing protein [Mangrovibacterium sp.]